jgi:hypothetical protein
MLQAPPPSGGLDPLFKDWVDVADKLVSILAIVGAGLFAYFKFFKERVYRPRLEPVVSSQFIATDRRQFLKVRATVKNTGLSKVDISLEPSYLRVFGATRISPTMADEPVWDNIAILDVSDRHEWIEPGEIIAQTWLVAIPAATTYPAFRSELRLVGTANDWYAEDVTVISEQKEANETTGGKP